MSIHSTVSYTEPNVRIGRFSATTSDMTNNYATDIWALDDGYDRAPRLEDYCIALNLEVEMSSRDTQGQKDVLILQWNGNDKETVSFMGGTRIGGYEIHGTEKKAKISSRDYLTTYYADMYVGDLIDYGTTEMIGIKSVNIEYAKSCVPIISIKFTDVRGLSLFQPTELSRVNSYDGIKGLNKDNVAQSFFQCFFKMPLPKFTIYIKGFYGKPVAYVMMCDDFQTNFNSETGDYDVDARFIGYSYSFMTDISFDALIAAPYSDYIGKKYWESEVKNERFFLWDKTKTKKMPMPTLYEIHSEFKKLIKTTESEMLDTTLTAEELTHEDELSKLNEIQNKYRKWYSELYNLLKEKYGKRYCFDFRDDRSENSDWIKIMVLTNQNTNGIENLKQDYTQYSESFKATNDDLYASIEEFNNSSTSYKKLHNVSKDFSKYTRVKVFNDCYVNRNTRKVEFGGFDNGFNQNRTMIADRLFYGENSDLNQIPSGLTKEQEDAFKEEVNKYKSGLKDFTLSTIYGDGTNQYTYAYFIEVDYSDISRRINVLITDAKKSSAQKEKAKRRKEHNRLMMSRMNWYPSVENFMRVMMAHVETYMMMMYAVQDACSHRTPKKMGVTVGPNGDASDVNKTNDTIPPFPRITQDEMGDDGITRKVDKWVGDINGEERFVEADLINGLFNAVEYLQKLVKEDAENSSSSEYVQEDYKPIVKHPLTSYDFFLTKSPYGSENDISNNPNAFAGKIAIRMFEILSLNNFKKEYGDKWSFGNPEFLKKLGEIEAENFHDNVKISNKTMLQMLGAEGGEGTITSKSIIECVTKNTPIGNVKDIPWQRNNTKQIDPLLSNDFWLDYYKSSYGTKLYPIQNMSFSGLENSLKIFNKGKDSLDYNNLDIMTSWIDTKANAWKLLNSKNTSCFGSAYIIDDYARISKTLDGACSSADNLYKPIYDLIHDTSVFNKDWFKNLIYKNGVFRPKKNVLTLKKYASGSVSTNSDTLVAHVSKNTRELLQGGGETVEYSFDNDKLESYTSEAENKSINSWFFTECRGFKKENDLFFRQDINSGLFTDAKYKSQIDSTNLKWTYGGIPDKRMGFFLMGLESIDYKTLSGELDTNKTFAYIPKIAVLQMGAALASMPSIETNITSVDVLAKNTPLPRTFEHILPYLNKINTATRLAYIRYFRDWVYKYSSNISAVLFKKENMNVAVTYNVGATQRALFREDSDFSKGLADNLMSPVVIAKGNVNHYKDVSKNGLTFSRTNAESFLDGFLSRLKALYGIKVESTSSAVKLAAEPNKTTDDMKRELYRYMKLVYEKWVPAMDRKEWKFETFFDLEAEKEIRNSNSGGHLFHFIDSFYNKIGDKLLINPMGLSELIDNALSTNNVNTMMLGFVADVLTKNKCMMLCLQNFQDLSEQAAMDMMFRPIPYNAIRDVNKHPDFVILYPYEPSKYLNVDNGEFADDSFMLNDEYETPLAIRSRGDDDRKYYRIPAFGVSYGKQYQSYFKRVNVGMKSPIATQQSIMAKHAILRASQDGGSQTTVAQDLYDVYSTQSYTCTVEMMGCAWVQPLMYFVLTNVPMFRGSYLIFKVTHKITPGNMTTEFMGTRMANISNKLVDEIFTDDDLDESAEDTITQDRRNALANVDNDCPYKVFSLFEDNVEMSANELTNANKAMRLLMSVNDSFTKAAAAGICGNIFKESSWKLHAKNGIGAFGLCQWLGARRDILFNKYGQLPTLAQQIEYIKYEWNNESVAKSHKSKLNASATTPEDAAYIVRKYFERPGEKEADDTTRKTKARLYYDNYEKTPSGKEVIKPNNKDIRDALFNAVVRSLNSVNSDYKIKKSNLNNTEFKIERVGENKLALVFDILLNGYYDYIQTIEWVANGNDNGEYYSDRPTAIIVNASENPNPQNRRVYIYHEGKKSSEITKKFGTDASFISKSLLQSLYKRYNANPINRDELPQFNNMDIFKDIQVLACDTLMNEGNYQSPSDVSRGDNGFIDGWNVGAACAHLISKAQSKTQHACARYVEEAIAAGGGPLKTKISTYENGANSHHATNLRYYGILEQHGFVMIDKGTVGSYGDTTIKLQSGDVAIIGNNAKLDSGNYHACMYCSQGWISDFKQKHMSPYSSSWPYAIYRYHNKQKA